MKRREFMKKTAVVTAAAVSSAVLTGTMAGAAPKSTGTAGEEKLLRLRDPGNPTTLEKKHVPLIEAPKQVKKDAWFEVTVKVGYKIAHPSTPGHWIDEIRLLVDGKEVGRIDSITGGTTSPDGIFRIRLQEPAVLTAIANCNLHGTWTGSPVKVAVSA